MPQTDTADPGAQAPPGDRPPSTWLTVGLGVVLGLVILGPLLRAEALFFLDLAGVPDPPVPRGFFGLGPEIPRSTPFDLIVFLPSAVLGGATTIKLVMAAAIAGAFVGMTRLLRVHGRLTAWTGGLLLAGSPFLLTRLVVGHLSIVVAAALLPFVLPVLAGRPDDGRRTFLAALALCAAGSYGGILAAIVVGTACLCHAPRRLLVAEGAVFAASLVWVVPGFTIVAGGPELLSSDSFPSGVDSVRDALALLAGHGFWQPLYQVGVHGRGVWLIGVILLGLALAGTRSLPEWGRPLFVAALGSLALTVVNAISLFDGMMDAFTSSAIGAPFREPQRYLVLYVTWVAAAAPLGALVLARRSRASGLAPVVKCLPLALSMLLLAPGTWGLSPLLKPVDVPGTWAEAREVVSQSDASTLVLPWARYLSLRFAEAPRTINPVPKYLGSDTLVSSDLGIGGSSVEGIDEREPTASALADRVAGGGDDRVVEDLRQLGVRWIFLLHEANHARYVPGLESSGLELVVVGSAASLYEVPGDDAAGHDEDGDPVDVEMHGPGLATVEHPGAFRWGRSHQWGWLRGLSPISVADDGVMDVPSGGAVLWYAPAAVILATDLAIIVVALSLARRSRRRPPREGSGTAAAG